MIEKIFELVNGISYTRDIPAEAKSLAKENGYIIIVGGSDDLMYCFGADSYLTDYIEHDVDTDGENFSKSKCNHNLKSEAKQIGLKVYWNGEIEHTGESIKDYDSTIKGYAFSYQVNSDLEFKEFTVFEDDDQKEIYCTGLIFKLPEYFISFKGTENG